MIRQDYLMSFIEELSRKIARLLRKKEEQEPEIDRITDSCYGDLKLDLDRVINSSAIELSEKIQQWELLELLVSVMIHDDRINGNTELMKKAQELLFYVQDHDRTWSYERTLLSDKLQQILSSE